MRKKAEALKQSTEKQTKKQKELEIFKSPRVSKICKNYKNYGKLKNSDVY